MGTPRSPMALSVEGAAAHLNSLQQQVQAQAQPSPSTFGQVPGVAGPSRLQVLSQGEQHVGPNPELGLPPHPAPKTASQQGAAQASQGMQAQHGDGAEVPADGPSVDADTEQFSEHMDPQGKGHPALPRSASTHRPKAEGSTGGGEVAWRGVGPMAGHAHQPSPSPLRVATGPFLGLKAATLGQSLPRLKVPKDDDDGDVDEGGGVNGEDAGGEVDMGQGGGGGGATAGEDGGNGITGAGAACQGLEEQGNQGARAH